jgi:hypothetical protein
MRQLTVVLKISPSSPSHPHHECYCSSSSTHFPPFLHTLLLFNHPKLVLLSLFLFQTLQVALVIWFSYFLLLNYYFTRHQPQEHKSTKKTFISLSAPTFYRLPTNHQKEKEMEEDVFENHWQDKKKNVEKSKLPRNRLDLLTEPQPCKRQYNVFTASVWTVKP